MVLEINGEITPERMKGWSHQRADRLKTTITEKPTNLITWTTALSNSMKL